MHPFNLIFERNK